jgi:hypothetical protein
MAQNQSREESSSSPGGSGSPRKVGMYDRPANANRQPLTIIIAVVLLVAAILSVAFFYLF